MGPSLVFGLGYGLGALNVLVEDIRAFPSFFLPTEEEFVEMDVGLGEELLLMSRHIGHQGITETVRFSIAACCPYRRRSIFTTKSLTTTN